MNKTKWIIIIAVILGIAVFAAFGFGHKTEAQYTTVEVRPHDIHQLVEATGTINAVTTVLVGSQVSGTISELHADFNSKVTKGEVIARIDPSLFQGNLQQAQADLDQARANLVAARANLDKSHATQAQQKTDYERMVTLAKKGVISQQALDLAKANAETSGAGVGGAEAAVRQAEATIAQKAAAVQVARTNLEHTVIAAPIAGTVISRSVDVGQTVAASLQAPTLFTIAQDLTKMQVYAKTDESDVGAIRTGQRVNFKVDAFPRDTFEGSVSQVRMNPTTVQNVVTYDTIIDFDNPDLKLFPGMTAYVTIPVASALSAPSVPNAALRFKPELDQKQLADLCAKFGISGGSCGFKRGSGAGAGTGGGGANAQSSGNSSGAPRSVGLPPDQAIVWKLKEDGSLEPVRIALGITDHNLTQVARAEQGDLKEGDKVITAAASRKNAGTGAGPGAGMGGPPRGR